MHHTNDAALVIQEDDVFSGSTLTVVGFDNILGNQAAGMVVVILSAAGGELAQRHRVQAGSTCGIAVATGDALAVTVVTVAVADHAGESGATGQAGQLALTPCSSLALIGSGTAHSVVGNSLAAESGQPVIGVTEGGRHRRTGGSFYILPFSPPAVKKKPPRPGTV